MIYQSSDFEQVKPNDNLETATAAAEETKNKKTFTVLNFILFGFFILSIFLNQFFLIKNERLLGVNSVGIFSQLSLKINSGGENNLSGNLNDDSVKLAFNQGAPRVYGEELGANFDQVEQSMNLLKQFDPTYGSKKIALSGEKLQRYINVGLKIACEYCCGATALIKPDGTAACGCAHSQAMRGLSAYLLQNHAAEYTDDQILQELARWKGRFFPKQMIAKTSEQLKSGNYTPDIAALLLNIKVPKYSDSSKGAPLPSAVKDLPGMVGGC